MTIFSKATSMNECSHSTKRKQMKKIVLITIALTGLFQKVLAQDSIGVLYIGNSYTYVNDLPATVSALATSLGKKTTFQTKANGGYTFQNHANDAATYTALHAKKWDVVVLQGQSQEPSFPYSQVNTTTLLGAKQLADSAYENNACGNVMYFMTWGRETGDPQWDSINTFDKMNARLYNAYMRIADSSRSAMVSPVGAVWKYVRDNFPTIALYSGDGSHPSAAGTYLAACTFYTSLFRSTPVGASYLGGLDAQTAGILQQAAATVLLPDLDVYHLHPVDQPTYANFSFTLSGNSLSTVNLSAQATSYVWDFGDGSSSIQSSPVHSYNMIGEYSVLLEAISNCNTDTTEKRINVTVLESKKNLLTPIYWYDYSDGIMIHGVPVNSKITLFDWTGKELEATINFESKGVYISCQSMDYLVRFTDDSGYEVIFKVKRSI